MRYFVLWLFGAPFSVIVCLWALSSTEITAKTVGENIDDTNITASVKAKLVADKVVNLTRIDVDTNRGVVSLNGVVESPDQRLRAAELALTANGVKDVINNLQL